MKKITNQRTFVSFPLQDLQNTKLQMLNWANRFNICCFLDNNEYVSRHNNIECLVAAGAMDTLVANAGEAFNKLAAFASFHNDWLFGHFGYDLKNETENQSSSHKDLIGFPDLLFFVPETIVELTVTHIRIGSVTRNADDVYRDIIGSSAIAGGTQGDGSQPAESQPHLSPPGEPVKRTTAVTISSRFSKSEYIDTVQRLQQHIRRGDCYEINFCQEFFVENTTIDPVNTFLSLAGKSPNPFSAFYKANDSYVLCASPERYLKKSGLTLTSQPIKGTLKRTDTDMPAGIDLAGQQDDYEGDRLAASAKDQSENVMIVDLVRNDLSKVCVEGSVVVEELFGIYTFPQVYQMISTVQGKLATPDEWLRAIQATFPMGSMTGAPKTSVLQLVERYERSRRGLFSGAIGYITPERDFDFNVVIRSILYNRGTGYVSFPAGSGITFYSDAEKEYEECLVKVEAIRSLLECRHEVEGRENKE